MSPNLSRTTGSSNKTSVFRRWLITAISISHQCFCQSPTTAGVDLTTASRAGTRRNSDFKMTIVVDMYTQLVRIYVSTSIIENFTWTERFEDLNSALHSLQPGSDPCATLTSKHAFSYNARDDTHPKSTNKLFRSKPWHVGP